jgi:hypothetical protein
MRARACSWGSPQPCGTAATLLTAVEARRALITMLVIGSVFLFQREALLAALTASGVKVGVATSVRKADWEAARIFPPPRAPACSSRSPSSPS